MTYETFTEALSVLFSAELDDPRVAEAAADWVDCMADAGFTDLATPEDDETSMRSADRDLSAGSPAGSGPSSDARAEFRALELSTALADFRCKQKVDWDTTEQQVRFELEKTFIKDNKALLDEYVAALTEARQPIG
ncbi:hypothetical protein SAMN05216410_1723 [Sanguibacter gelidistatuariae]|uniref:Uncharacterized protein n=1 Tax=Sanguibacter gelidistatuariae TaxID=1814289 RepID=A0A1G6KZ45_9MICO|nr:hypothetical protein [Sanguibacter gelidistatuariae]SDC36224.1 hypothetical protein SAMN05216410_1723 [Sanguibacter gelidistatuariae]